MTILKDSKADVLSNRLDVRNKQVTLAYITTAERDALPEIKNGDTIVNSTVGKLQVRIADAWVDQT